jgi:hypothetical protein
MWEPQPLTTLRASKACRGENFTFTQTLQDCVASSVLYDAEAKKIPLYTLKKKLSLPLIKHRTMKTGRGVEVGLHALLTSILDDGE